jgi:hypothetical protein
MIPERLADVEEEVFGIDEEVRVLGALKVVAGGDRRDGGDQAAGANSAARPPDHDAEAVVLAEAVKEVDEPYLAAFYRDLERRAAQFS